ncbi:uncharacterized protein LOC107426660 [Ziziphus jujuba]|uniref:Uncharacterized protein LOC107426660 n=1 Tax=Ziziphus jujuba TaxID=326968 RepID=A0A6P4A8T3_ZIZJJ|nr:uncharacterized protein LOC107426660 [Ziziphus jujuba]
MKKMKGVVAMEPSLVFEDTRNRFKLQSLMQDYEELEKETEVMKQKMTLMNQKKLTLLAEVRFLKRRYKYLIDNQSMKPRQPNKDITQLQNYEIRSVNTTKAKNYIKKGAPRYPVPVLELNQRERNRMEATLEKSVPILDLHHKMRTFGGMETALQSSKPVFDLNQQERFHSGKEVTKRKNIPAFDLNQISREEEELQANCEPLGREDSMKSLLRGGNDEQHNDMKLLLCRNIGNGPSRAGKRKITWQDQVALRV